MRGVMVTLPDSLLEKVRERAARDVRSLKEELQWLIQMALEHLEECEARRQGLPGAGAAGPETHHTHQQGGEHDAQSE